MSQLAYLPLPTDAVRALQKGAPDAHGLPAEQAISDGSGLPCRHCLREIAAGERYLILSYRPFPAAQPYAEQGPIFLHAKACEAYPTVRRLPEMVRNWEAVLLRGYDRRDRIVYGTGQTVPSAGVGATAAALLARGDVAYLHARSATNNCYQFRIERVKRQNPGGDCPG